MPIQFMLPEVLLFVGGFLILTLDYLNMRVLSIPNFIAIGSLLVALIISIIMYNPFLEIDTNFMRHGTFISITKSFNLVLGFFVTFLFIKRVNVITPKNTTLALLLFLIFSLNLILLINNFVAFYILTELQIICFVFMFLSETKSEESYLFARNYLLSCIIFSALILLGITLIYYKLETFNMSLAAAKFIENKGDSALTLGFGLLVTSFLFQYSTLPFYVLKQKSTSEPSLGITSLVTTAQLFTAFVIFIKLLNMAAIGIENIAPILFMLILVITIFSGIKLLKNNETNLTHALLFISLLECNFVFANLFFLSKEYISSAILQLISLTITNLGVIYCVYVYKKEYLSPGEGFNIESLRGLGKHNTILALCFTTAFLSFIGIPPTSGFFSKFETIQNFTNNGYYALSTLLILCHLILVVYISKLISYIYWNKGIKFVLRKHPTLMSGVALLIALLIIIFPLYKNTLSFIIEHSVYQYFI